VTASPRLQFRPSMGLALTALGPVAPIPSGGQDGAKTAGGLAAVSQRWSTFSAWPVIAADITANSVRAMRPSILLYRGDALRIGAVSAAPATAPMASPAPTAAAENSSGVPTSASEMIWPSISRSPRSLTTSGLVAN